MTGRILTSATSWADVVKGIGRLPSGERGELFEHLTQLLLQVSPIYRQKLRHVWRHREVPHAVRRHLKLPVQDIGIDLVAETTTGDYWAIQCKYHDDPHQNLTLNELRPFLHTAHTVCGDRFSTLLVVSSANGYAPTLRRHSPEVQYILGDTFRSLDMEFFKGVRALLRHKTPRLIATRPRPHQRRAIRNAVAHFKTAKETRGKLIHPCGSGKSLTAFWIAEALGAKSILVAVPSLQLVRQQLAVWARESVAKGREMEWIAVCSEGKIGAIERDDPALHLQELGIQVTTDAAELTAFLKRRHRGHRVVFTTYQSGRVVSRATREAKFTFDLGIYDEAHKTVGAESALFGELLTDDRVAVRKRIFMTATERRYRGESDKILSMDDQSIYGDAFDVMTFREALEQDPPILSDYRIITSVVTRAEVRALVDRNLLVKPDTGQWNEETDARTLAAVVALRKSMQRHHFNHVLSFHSSVAKARAFRDTQASFTEAAPEFGALECFHVSGKNSTGERQERIEEFVHAKQALMTNARCLTEGVDVPTIDAVLFADPKRSTVDIVQAVGRALRRSKGKKRGYVIVPVFIDEEDPEAADEAYADILLTLRALASQDDRIIDWFRSVAQGKRPSGKRDLFEVDVPATMAIDLSNFVSSIETKAWHRLARLSWRSFEQAREFVRKVGLRNQGEWTHYCKGDLPNKPPKPRDIPTAPYDVYDSSGWVSMGDWLGTGTVASQNMAWRPFKHARRFVRGLRLGNQGEWKSYCANQFPDKSPKPDDIPASPWQVYRSKGWRGFGDWLGSGNPHWAYLDWRPFRQARMFVRTLGLTSEGEWRRYCAGRLPENGLKPDDIPANPAPVYKSQGWRGFGDWLGTGSVRAGSIAYRSFQDAKEFVHSLDLSSEGEWRSYCRGELPDKGMKPYDIPASPARVFRDQGWRGLGDWLGTGNLPPGTVKYRRFKEARQFARSLKLRSNLEWRRYKKGELLGKPSKPDDIPASPNHVYMNKGWRGFGDWLGTGNLPPGTVKYRRFKEARQFARSLKLRSNLEWRRYMKGEVPGKPQRPSDIPAHPELTYLAEGWNGWRDWLMGGDGARGRIVRSEDEG